MLARRTTATTRASARTSAPPPRGARIPHPALVVYLARSVFIGALLLFLATPFLLTWAHAHESPSAPTGEHNGLLSGLLTHATPAPAGGATYEHIQAEDRSALEHSDQVAPLIATVVIAVFTPHVVRDLEAISLLGLGLMLGEALLALWGWFCQRRTLPRIPTTYDDRPADRRRAHVCRGDGAARPASRPQRVGPRLR